MIKKLILKNFIVSKKLNFSYFVFCLVNKTKNFNKFNK